GRRVGAPHSEVDDGDAIASRIEHRTVFAAHGYFMPLGELAHIIAEVDQQDVFTEVLQRRARVTWQPVGHNFSFAFHGFGIRPSIPPSRWHSSRSETA